MAHLFVSWDKGHVRTRRPKPTLVGGLCSSLYRQTLSNSVLSLWKYTKVWPDTIDGATNETSRKRRYVQRRCKLYVLSLALHQADTGGTAALYNMQHDNDPSRHTCTFHQMLVVFVAESYKRQPDTIKGL